MAKKRAFISFDFHHDEELRDTLVGQSKLPNLRFSISDYSIHKRLNAIWRKKVRKRIRVSDLTIVICGEHTHDAKGVAAEVTISREEGKPYFLLKGRPKRTCTKPRMARRSDKIYKWTENNLTKLINGERW